MGLNFLLMVPAKGTLVLTIPLDPELPTKAHRIVFSHGDADHGMEEKRYGREREVRSEAISSPLPRAWEKANRARQETPAVAAAAALSPLPGTCNLLLAPAWAEPCPLSLAKHCPGELCAHGSLLLLFLQAGVPSAATQQCAVATLTLQQAVGTHITEPQSI